jgi:hypothetical protein
MRRARARDLLLEVLFPPETTDWLSVLRLGLGLQVILFSMSLRSDWNHLFASNGAGLISRDLSEAISSFETPLSPRLGGIVAAGNALGLDEHAVLFLGWLALLCSGCLLLIGLFSRPAAITAWLMHLCAVNSGGLLSYGMDNFTTIGLFYLMLSPLPDRFSLDARFWRSRTKDPQIVGFFRRVLQFHVCAIYFFGGVAKCIGPGWWDGSSLWRALTRPPFNIISPETITSWKTLLPFLGISVCILETGYPLFIWLRRTRLIWLLCVLAMHISIALTMGMYLFAFIMIVLNLAAFGPDFSFRLERIVPDWLKKGLA